MRPSLPVVQPASSRPDTERVVVTAWGMVSPLGGDAEQTFAAMREGRSGIDHLTRFEPEGMFCKIAGEIDDAHLGPDDATAQRVGSGWRAAGPALDQLMRTGALADFSARDRIGVVVGGHGETPQIEGLARMAPLWDEHGRVEAAAAAVPGAHDARAFTRRQPDTVPSHIAHVVDARGPVIPIVSACAAGTQAIGEGVRLIRDGRCDAVIAGGAEPLICYTGFLGFAILGALTRRHPSPQEASRPFDRRRNGFVLAEGAGLVLLETLASAKARGATPLGEILGYGDSSDAHLITAMHPEGNGAVRAMSLALEDAGLPPTAVEYVNAHGTSTGLNDPVETKALRRVLGEHADRVLVSSNKSMIGHSLAGAGVIEAILTWIGMREGVVLPTINQTSPDPKCDLDYVPNEARAVPHTVALSNSFGFGGQNGSLCLGAAPSA